MKKQSKTLLALLTCALVVASASLARAAVLPTANFIFDNGSGSNSGSYSPGSSFTFSISLQFAPGISGGTNISDLNGLSYYILQTKKTPPFYFAITNRNFTGSLFTDAQTPGITYPQALNPENPSDLGALSAAAQPSGTYFIANLTVSIASNAAPGLYTLGDTTSSNASSPGKVSTINDSAGDAYPISQQVFNVTVVPEPSTTALLAIGAIGAAAILSRRRLRQS